MAGAVRFVESLPADLPKAICSSSSSHWVKNHLANLGLEGAFGEMIFSGREHVERGKPAPDLYLHAADALGVPIERIAIVEDSPVGVEGALASGADGDRPRRRPPLPARPRGAAARARRPPLARDFDEVAALLR